MGLHGNNFDNVPDSIFTIGTLENLDLSDNQFSQSITQPLTALAANAKSLDLASFHTNAFTGTIPDGLNDASNGFQALRTLDLANNQITGELPESIFFPTLRRLRVNDNLLSGE